VAIGLPAVGGAAIKPWVIDGCGDDASISGAGENQPEEEGKAAHGRSGGEHVGEEVAVVGGAVEGSVGGVDRVALLAGDGDGGAVSGCEVSGVAGGVGVGHESGSVDAVTIPRGRGTLRGWTVHVAIRHNPPIPKKFRSPV